MNNQPKPVNRSLAFWLGLSIHLILGATLYHQTQDTKADTRKTEISKDAVADTPVMP